MDFEVVVGNIEEGATPFAFSTFDAAWEFIRQDMAQWNNFHPELLFKVQIRKIPSDTEAFGVHSGENIKAKDVFGRR